MGVEVTEKVTCDVCGERIHGDYMTVEMAVGFSEVTFVACIPRTAPINPCGNVIRDKILALFPKAPINE